MARAVLAHAGIAVDSWPSGLSKLLPLAAVKVCDVNVCMATSFNRYTEPTQGGGYAWPCCPPWTLPRRHAKARSSLDGDQPRAYRPPQRQDTAHANGNQHVCRR